MGIIDHLTPKDTEEIKPGLYIQKTRKGYKKIEPVAWKGKMRWGPQIRSVFSLRMFVTIAIVIFLAYSYTNDNEQLIGFYNFVHEDPVQFCDDVNLMLQSDGCTQLFEDYGLCYQGNFSDLKLEDGAFKDPNNVSTVIG